MGAMAIVGMAIAVATRTLTTAEALSGFSNATVWLVVTAFFIAAGFIKTGLGRKDRLHPGGESSAAAPSASATAWWPPTSSWRP